MILGNQVEWALHCMVLLARLPHDISVPVALLSEFHDVPKEYLAKALQQLTKRGLLMTQKGAKGGYRLARSAKQINLLEIIEAVEGQDSSFRCKEIRMNNPCLADKKKPSYACPLAVAMNEADQAWRSVLSHKTLEDICGKVATTVNENTLQQSEQWFLSRI